MEAQRRGAVRTSSQKPGGHQCSTDSASQCSNRHAPLMIHSKHSNVSSAPLQSDSPSSSCTPLTPSHLFLPFLRPFFFSKPCHFIPGASQSTTLLSFSTKIPFYCLTAPKSPSMPSHRKNNQVLYPFFYYYSSHLLSMQRSCQATVFPVCPNPGPSGCDTACKYTVINCGLR